MYLTTYEVQMLLELHGDICLRNSGGSFCNNIIRDDVYSADPEDGIATEAPAPTAFCNNCFLSRLKYRIEQPLGGDDDYRDVLSSLTSSCGSTTGFSVTTPASTTFSIRASGSPVPSSCDGTQYTVQSGDTCVSVSLARGMNTNQLLKSNQLIAYCRDFPSSGSICIPDRWVCEPYALRNGDTCRSIAMRHGISYAQVVAWNPDVGSFCQNIAALAADSFTICISNPGGSWEHPFPEEEPEPETTTISRSAIEYGISMATHSSLPSPTRDDFLPNLGWLDPLANGTRDDCYRYSGSEVVIDTINSTVSSECGAVAEAYGVTEGDLTEWNPDLLATPGEDYPCQLRPGFRYCVQDEMIRASTLTRFCVRESMALPGWECEDLLNLLNIPVARFAEWNPVVGSDCDNYSSGHMYCTSVQGFRPAGQISTCNRWEEAESSDPDTCGEIEAKYNLQHARFVAWNPSVRQDCSGIVRGYEYCVGTPAFPPPT